TSSNTTCTPSGADPSCSSSAAAGGATAAGARINAATPRKGRSSRRKRTPSRRLLPPPSPPSDRAGKCVERSSRVQGGRSETVNERWTTLRAHPSARRFIRAVLLVAHGFRGEAITLRAAALTYLTLLALVPLLAVVYSVVDLFTGEAQIHDRLQSYVNSQLGIGAGAAIAGALTTFTSKATVKTLGAIGFALLLVSALSLLWNIESAFNHIYAVRKPRSPVQRLLKYWTFLTLGPIFLSLSVYVSWTISRMQDTHGPHSYPNHSEVLHVLAALSSVAITYASLAFLYKVIPNARVRVRSALLAALIAGSAWEVAKFLFAWASGRMVQLHRIYGSVAALPIT